MESGVSILNTGQKCIGVQKDKYPIWCPLIKLCHRVPYEEPPKAEDGNADHQRDGVDVEQAVKGEPVQVPISSFHFIL